MIRLRRRKRPRRHELTVTHQTVYLSRLAPSCGALRIVHLSDIHHGLYTRLNQVEQVVEIANNFHPDLVALTGDFVSNSRNYVVPVAKALGSLKARLGVFAVLGNHDYRVGADAMTQALEQNGISVLRNRHVQLGANGTRLAVAGVDDFGYGEADLQAALRSVPDEMPVFLLSHNPALAPLAATFAVDLVLSGHTHGGQMGLHRLHSAARRRGVSVPFRHGMEQCGDTQVYISRGIGTVVLPLRVKCPPEIPVLRLESLQEPFGASFPSDTYASL